jgi:hypothetical protein
MVQSVIRWYIGQCDLRSSSPCPMYHLRTLCTIFKLLRYGAKSPQMVHWARWAKKLKYGTKNPQVVHWAMWAKKFKIWCKASSGYTSSKLILPNVPPEDALHHILSFLAHIAQCTTWGRFAPYFKLLSSHRHQLVHWAMWAKKFKIWFIASSCGTLGNVS